MVCFVCLSLWIRLHSIIDIAAATKSLTTFLTGCPTLFVWKNSSLGLENGCEMAEFLAIDDEEKQHKRLVRYYRQVGFQVVKYVGDGFQDIPDRLIWGGAGTLMNGSVDIFCQKWTALMQSLQQRRKKKISP